MISFDFSNRHQGLSVESFNYNINLEDNVDPSDPSSGNHQSEDATYPRS
jgi:hypothetical protein